MRNHICFFRYRGWSQLFTAIYVIISLSGCNERKSTSPFSNKMHVPEGFFIEEAVPPGMVVYPMFATLDNTGRLFVIESSGQTTSTEDVLKNPTFFIRLLEDTDRDGV